MPPPRRRKSVGSDSDGADSSLQASPPAARKDANIKKRAPAVKRSKTSDADSSLELSAAPARAKTATKQKRKRAEDDEEHVAPAKTKAPGKAVNKRSRADNANGKASSSQDLSRLQESSDSDIFEFTTEAYRAPAGASSQQPSASQPVMRKVPNGKAPAAKASSQPLPSRTADAKGKKRAEPVDIPANSSKSKPSAPRDRSAMPPPPQPTTPRGKTQLNPLLHRNDASAHDSTVALGVAETPMQNRNIAMRKAADDVPSGSRRTSLERRGRRSSIVGDGFEGVPHSSVEDRLLHRHLNPDDVPHLRFLTLASWAAQRQAKSLSEDAASSSSTDAKMQDLAQKAAEAFIANIARQGIDLHWAEHAADEQAIRPRAKLKKNEANLANERKRDQLTAWNDRLNAEATARSNVKPRYAALQAPRQASAALAAVPTGNVDFATALPDLRSPRDVLKYGRSLLSKAQTDPQPVEDAARVDVEAELSVSFDDLRLSAASLKQQTHRVEQLARLGNDYAASRIASAHRALGSVTTGSPPLPEAADLLRALTRAELPASRR